MVYTKRLREGIRRGRITCSVRIWTRPHVKAGGRYRMDDGHIVVDTIVPIRLADITHDLARESGFSGVHDLMHRCSAGRPTKARVTVAATGRATERARVFPESSESARLTTRPPSRARATRRRNSPTRRE